MMRFSVNTTKSNPKKYSWWLYGENNRMVAWAGQTFDSHWDAERAAQDFKEGASSADFDVYLDEAKKWRWRAVRSSDKVAASGEAFASKHNAQHAADNVQENASYADGPTR
jgi:uncharacterized protein YegP (UPF0339 family)